MATLSPVAAVRRLAPGESDSVVFTFKSHIAQSGFVAFVEGGQGAFEFEGLKAFRSMRVPYSEEELDEFQPKSFRDRMQREGKEELVFTHEVGSNTPLNIPEGGTVVAKVGFHAGAMKGKTASGKLVLKGLTQNEAKLALVTGSGMAVCKVEPSPLRAVLPPGGTARATVVVSEVPVTANVMALIEAFMGGLSIEEITVFKTERIPFTEEELDELPPAMREAARRDGHPVSRLIQSAKAGEAFEVPAGGSMQVKILMQSPREAFDIDGILHISADRWAPIEVSIYPRAQAVSVELGTDRVEVMQGGEPVELITDIKLHAFSPIAVNTRLGDPGDPWAIDTTEESVPVSTGGSHRLRLQVRVPSDCPVGEFPTFLFLKWNDGVGVLSVPVTIVVKPGEAAVLAFTPRFIGRQGSEARVSVRVDVDSRKQVVFSPVWLPRGVTLLPTNQRWFDPGAHPLDLVFAIDPNAQVGPDQAVLVEWDAMDGQHRGRLSFRLTVLFTRQERRFVRRIITPDGIPLGGEAEFILSNDGKGRFRGYMRATGVPSFSFQVVATVRSPDGKIAVLGQRTGNVYGTENPFKERQYNWDIPAETFMLAENWPSIATAEMSVSRAFEFGGLVGAAVEGLRKLIDIVVGLAVLAPVPGGAALAVLAIAASDFGELTGFDPIGPGGFPGLLVTAGASFLFGPGVLLPVFAVSTGIGTAAFRHRELSSEEIAFAEKVFGEGILPIDRIRITNLVGFADLQFTCPGLDRTILVNLGAGFSEPIHFKRPLKDAASLTPEQLAEKEDVPGQLFIHELTHAWQVGHGAFDAEYFWRGTINKGLRTSPYDYGPPEVEFSDFGLEGQASVVEEWFAGKQARAPHRFFKTKRQPMDRADPYFRYILDNIRLGRP